eukprot:CAMPEP_0172566930 /NCGR_PEP_ID=MMETSP1067-20121228/113820_1 /TAXON_ID=265564 ORGANISM="Thalassiosira punctigera, Strain Tpunct2005C2" /NCGR_SAMPLE_ID=MMETSP1067 /ASSEMBLY_ACC=CAM_ASM_000444 /LENGTH=358 /DNA_ID=CAMNT_0013358161 /DNA_START=125 /DNA_END=1198 /DNA_ORIENTATION=+
MLSSTLRRGRSHLKRNLRGERAEGPLGTFYTILTRFESGPTSGAVASLCLSRRGLVTDNALEPIRYVKHSDVLRVLGGNNTSERITKQSHDEKLNFAAFAKSKSYLLHVPKSFLDAGFRQCYILNASSSFAVEEMIHEKKKFYHATFKDPRTNEEFPSGLGRPINAEKRLSTTLATPLHLAEVSILGGKVYYRELKLAEHAAAGRAIDCYIFREEGADTKNAQLCFEPPYKTMKEGLSQNIDYNELLDMRNHLSLDENNNAHFSANGRKISTLSTFAKSKPFFLHVPKKFLDDGLRQCYGIHQLGLGDSYAVEEMEHEGKMFYHATFKDPFTLEEFSSGLGRPIDVEKRHDSSLATPL